MPVSAAKQVELIDGGLRLLLDAVHANDPKREILVRVGDLMRDVSNLTAAVSDQVVVPSALADIAAERQRQTSVEGYDTAHDDAHTDKSLAQAAFCYAYASVFNPEWSGFVIRYWPWDRKYWKPSNGRRNLVKAGALIVAEIERLDRVAPPPPSKDNGPDTNGGET